MASSWFLSSVITTMHGPTNIKVYNKICLVYYVTLFILKLHCSHLATNDTAADSVMHQTELLLVLQLKMFHFSWTLTGREIWLQ